MDGWRVGLLSPVVLTLAFVGVFGYYLMGRFWANLAAEYNRLGWPFSAMTLWMARRLGQASRNH